jgi:hypothetical protein
MFLSDREQEYLDTIAELRQELREVERQRDRYGVRAGGAMACMGLMLTLLIIYFIYEIVQLFH